MQKYDFIDCLWIGLSVVTLIYILVPKTIKQDNYGFYKQSPKLSIRKKLQRRRTK